MALQHISWDADALTNGDEEKRNREWLGILDQLNESLAEIDRVERSQDGSAMFFKKVAPDHGETAKRIQHGRFAFYRDPVLARDDELFIACEDPANPGEHFWGRIQIGDEILVSTAIGYTLTFRDGIVVATAAPITITLPLVAGMIQKPYRFKNIAATGTVTIAATGPELIDGAATTVLTAQYQNVTLFPDKAAAAWHIV